MRKKNDRQRLPTRINSSINSIINHRSCNRDRVSLLVGVIMDKKLKVKHPQGLCVECGSPATRHRLKQGDYFCYMCGSVWDDMQEIRERWDDKELCEIETEIEGDLAKIKPGKNKDKLREIYFEMKKNSLDYQRGMKELKVDMEFLHQLPSIK